MSELSVLPFPVADAPEPRPVPAAPFQLGHRPWLDGLRGIAILVVLAYHFGFIRSGYLGVDLFFVLSGFLITSLLMEEWQSTGGIHLGRFYLRRILRLVPALAAMLIGTYAYVLVYHPDRIEAYQKEVIVAACYLTNWPEHIPVPVTTLTHTWSLSVEEQFYLAWPLMLLGMLALRLDRRWIAGLVVAGILAALGLRIGLVLTRAPEMDIQRLIVRTHMGLDTRADTLLVGCLLGLAVSWNWLPRSQSAGRAYLVLGTLSTIGLATLMVTRPLWPLQYAFGLYTLVALMTAAILARMLLAPSKWELRLLEFPPLVGLGKISYGVYLIHVPVALAFGRPLGMKNPGNVLFVTSVSIVLAIVSYFAIERPFLRLKGRFRSTPPKAVESPQTRAA